MEKKQTLEIEVETKGFEEATEKVETLADAYDSFPAQVNIRGSRSCTFNIYPSQTKIVELPQIEEEDEETEDDPKDHWNAMVPPEEHTVVANPNGAIIMSYKTYELLKDSYDKVNKRTKAKDPAPEK